MLLVIVCLMFSYPGYCKSAQPPFHIGSSLSRAMQKWTGVNFCTTFLVNRITTFTVRRKVGGHVQAKVGIYSLTDLLAGKLRFVRIALNGSSYKGIPLGKLSISSIHPIRLSFRNSNKHKFGLTEPLLLGVEGSLTEKQLASALENPDVASKLRMIKLDLPGLGDQQLQLIEPKVKFEDGLVKVTTLLVTKGAKQEAGVNLSVTGRPHLEDESRIILDDMQVDSPDIVAPDAFSSFSETLLNPLVDFRKMDRVDHAFRLKRFQLSRGQLDFAGNLLLAPKTQYMQLAQKMSGKK